MPNVPQSDINPDARRGLGHLIGKYRGLAVAIALFLVLDLGVLAFSFYVSSQIQGDASRINRASELRMLTQQVAKSLLTLRDETGAGMPTQTSIAQLSEARPIFNRTLSSLADDLAAQGKDGLQRLLLGTRLDDSSALLDRLSRTWQPLDSALQPVLASVTPGKDDVDIAANKAVALNIKLSQQADDLAEAFEKTAVARAATLKRVQIVGIALATLNFIFIVLKFLRSLAVSDQRVEDARRETRDILATVREGLFLIHRDGSLSREHSASLEGMLGVRIAPGMTYRDLFQRMLRGDELTAACEYLDLLLGGKVAPSLVAQLNPMTSVSVAHAEGETRQLTFHFVRVGDANLRDDLLVTVQDITENERLGREVEAARARATAETLQLSELLAADAGDVTTFVTRSEEELLVLNGRLKELTTSPFAQRDAVDAAFRRLHAMKGQSTALGLRAFAQQCHTAEEMLSALRSRDAIRGEDWIPVTLEIARLLEELSRIARIIEQLAAYGGARRRLDVTPERMLRTLTHLARTGASESGRKVELHAEGLDLLCSEGLRSIAQDVLPQLVRNAVAHGIESPAERLAAGKPGAGRIHIAVSRDADGLAVAVRDDGRGISAAHLRESLEKTGRFTVQGLAAMDERALVATLFEPGVSTAQGVDAHSGRGVGLDLVKVAVTNLGGRIRVMSQPGRFTEFRLVLPVVAEVAA